VIPCGLLLNMKSKQTQFLVAVPAYFGVSPIFIACVRDSGLDVSEVSEGSTEGDEKKSEISWIRSALDRASRTMGAAWITRLRPQQAGA